MALVLASAAERIHHIRTRRMGRLAFGPDETARAWTFLAPYIRVLCVTALAWSLIILMQIKPKVIAQTQLPKSMYRHVILVLDASPSMKIADSGMNMKLTRDKRASQVLKSIFDRIRVDQATFSVVAVYTGAKPVVIDTVDMAVINNIMDDLPLDYAFEYGKTKLIDGINLAAEMAADYDDDSTTIILASDGDTVPDSGLASLPPSVSKVLLLGFGSRQGKFLDGHQSRQDMATLRSIARRLGGEYYDANVRNLPDQAIKSLSEAVPMSRKNHYGLRELALTIAAAASAILALLPLALNFCGSKWHDKLKASA